MRPLPPRPRPVCALLTCAANLSPESYAGIISSARGEDEGVFYGWARVRDTDDGVHGMVMSVGWNPQYANAEKSVEVHVLHTFPSDFYGATLQVMVLGYLRPMAAFASLDALIAAIHADIARARELLARDEAVRLKAHAFWQS